MSILDSKLLYITENDFNTLSNGNYGIVYKIKDKVNQPEFIWDGLKFVQSLTYPAGDVVNLDGLYIINSKFGDSNNYTEFEQTGVMVAHGSAQVWRDIDFPIIERTFSTGRPAPGSFIGDITAPVWQINDYSVCEGQELIHSWKEGSDIQWHCHIFTGGTDTSDRYLKWELQWAWGDINNQVLQQQTITTDDFLIPANTPDRTHLVISIETVNIPGHIAGHVFARLKRITSTGTAPSNNPFCTMLQMHIQIDTLGSRQLYVK